MRESHWLEGELNRALHPVEAPEALWDRIEGGRDRQAVRSPRWQAWPVAAVLALALAGTTIWRTTETHSPRAGLDALAARQLLDMEDPAPRLDFDSSDPVAVRSWVKTKTELNVELPARNPEVRLLGARLIQSAGGPIAAIAYRVGNERAALLVSRNGRAGAQARTRRHVFSKTGLSSWSMRGQVYSIAYSGKDPRAGCLLCHVESRAD